MISMISGAPICTGEASPLRVATGGDANWRFGVRLRRSPARANARRDNRSGSPGEASLLRSSEKQSKHLTHIGHLFMTNPRASLRSDSCPISIGIGVRLGLEQVSAFAGIRTRGASFPPGADMRRPSLGQLRHYLWRRSTWNMPLAVRQRLILAARRRQTPRFYSEMASSLTACKRGI